MSLTPADLILLNVDTLAEFHDAGFAFGVYTLYPEIEPCFLLPDGRYVSRPVVCLDPRKINTGVLECDGKSVEVLLYPWRELLDS